MVVAAAGLNIEGTGCVQRTAFLVEYKGLRQVDSSIAGASAPRQIFTGIDTVNSCF
jgi:hypothetical protein